jgi:predicted GNAT family acetyltransferase
MSTNSPTPSVVRNDERGRYEIHVDGDLAGFANFIPGEGSIAFTHTETLEAFAGRGLGLELAKAAIADSVERGDTIIPICPFFRRYLEKNEVPGATVHFPEAR